jgi:hypothetical protein
VSGFNAFTELPVFNFSFLRLYCSLPLPVQAEDYPFFLPVPVVGLPFFDFGGDKNEKK